MRRHHSEARKCSRQTCGTGQYWEMVLAWRLPDRTLAHLSVERPARESLGGRIFASGEYRERVVEWGARLVAKVIIEAARERASRTDG